MFFTFNEEARWNGVAAKSLTSFLLARQYSYSVYRILGVGDTRHPLMAWAGSLCSREHTE
jgi:hypothetical protein